MSLFAESNGVGRPIVLVHGLFGSSTNWRGIARELAKQYQVHNVDMPNHGRSPHTSSMTYNDMGDALFAFAEERGLDDTVWIGHSMGGKAAMDLALRYPEEIGKLIVIDIAPTTYQHSYLDHIDAMLDLDLSQLSSRSQADKVLAGVVTDDMTRGFLLQNLVAKGQTYSWRINLPLLRQYHLDIVGFPEYTNQFSGPTLFISGEGSDYVTTQQHPTIRQLFPKAEFRVMADAGHWVHADQPKALVQAIFESLL